MENRISLSRGLLLALAIVLLAGITLSWATTRIENWSIMTYTDTATGVVTELESNRAVTTVTIPPKMEGVPGKSLPGQVSTLTFTCDIGGPEFTYKAKCRTWGGTYIPNSAKFTGTTGKVLSVAASEILVQFDPLANPLAGSNLVSCSYDVKW